jgi:hypothetical protein
MIRDKGRGASCENKKGDCSTSVTDYRAPVVEAGGRHVPGHFVDELLEGLEAVGHLVLGLDQTRNNNCPCVRFEDEKMKNEKCLFSGVSFPLILFSK